VLLPRQDHAPTDELKRFVETLPAKAGSEGRVALERALERRAERRELELADQETAHLREVGAAGGPGEDGAAFAEAGAALGLGRLPALPAVDAHLQFAGGRAGHRRGGQ
jgi:hypothetical protein